jgi:hypothetical protein
MIHRSLFPRDVFAELDRLQREMQQGFRLSPSIRGIARGGFPAMNVGGTPQSVEIYAFAPGIDAATSRRADRERHAHHRRRAPAASSRRQTPRCISTSVSRVASGAW